MPACPGKSIAYGYFTPEPIHCPHCRDAAPPVLTAEEAEHVRIARAVYRYGGGLKDACLFDLLAVIDRITSCEKNR